MKCSKDSRLRYDIKVLIMTSLTKNKKNKDCQCVEFSLPRRAKGVNVILSQWLCKAFSSPNQDPRFRFALVAWLRQGPQHRKADPSSASHATAEGETGESRHMEAGVEQEVTVEVTSRGVSLRTTVTARSMMQP